MRAHVIRDDVVVDTIEVESLDFMPGLIDGSVGGIGWRMVGGKLVEPAPASQSPEEINGPIFAALEGIDRKSIRALREGNQERITSLEEEAATLRARLVKA